MNKTLSGQFGELKKKEKVQLGNPKWSRSLTGAFHYKATIKRGFTKVVLTRAGRLRELSQGELRLYITVPQKAHDGYQLASSVCLGGVDLLVL